MAKTNFYLDNPKSEEATPIFLFFSFNGKRMKIATDEKIHPKHWNPESQTARRSFTGCVEFNLRLEQFGNDVERLYRELILSGVVPTPDKLKLQVLLKVKNKSSLAFMDCFQRFIDESKLSKRKNTISKYLGVLNQLNGYRQAKRSKIEFDDIGSDFYRKFSEYLIKDIGNTNNTVIKNIKTIKAFMGYANKAGWTNNKDYKDFDMKEQDGEVYFLTLKELMHLYNLKIKDKELERVRDVYCFGCFTGLRYSDIAQLSHDHIRDGYISLVHIKGSDSKANLVPLNKYAKEILEKYKSIPVKALPVIGNQKTNKYLKDLGKLAGFNYPVIQTRYLGSERIEKRLKKYEVLTMHTGRKTFITNSIYLGMNSEIIMSITGQKTRKAFKRYFDIVSDVKKTEMEKIWDST